MVGAKWCHRQAIDALHVADWVVRPRVAHGGWIFDVVTPDFDGIAVDDFCCGVDEFLVVACDRESDGLRYIKGI